VQRGGGAQVRALIALFNVVRVRRRPNAEESKEGVPNGDKKSTGKKRMEASRRKRAESVEGGS